MDEFQREQCLKHEIRYNVIHDVLSIKDKVMKFTISDNNSVGGWQNLEFPAHLRKRADADFFKEFVHSTTYKTAGIMKVLEQLNIHPAEMIAIGDYYNDIDMIEYAGLGIAMGNAPDAVKAAAKDVTLSNDEDGVYHALQKHLFQ
jgi:hydroxymethylpyrimidine pyrophosphatase-like HAD family hydrolase